MTLRVVVTATSSAGSASSNSTITEVIAPPGRVTKYAYDANDNLETVTDPDGHTTKYTYNADNKLTKTEDPDGATTETEYNTEGQMIGETNGDKQTTKYVRNILGEVTEMIDPLGRKTVKEYDNAGNLTSLTDPLKRTTTYTYDPANRLTEASYSDGKTHSVKYEYDPDGNRTSMSDGTGTTIYSYDQLDRLTESKDGHGDTTVYEYNLDNEPTKITYPNGKAIERAYDSVGRLHTVTDWLGHATTFSYDPDSDLTATTFPSETNEEDTYGYDDAGQMSEVKMSKGSEVLASLAYARDENEQITGTISKGLPGEEEINDTYNANNQLTKSGATSYEYDAANNPTQTGSSTNTYDSADELEKGTEVSYTYNEMGQRTKTSPTSGHPMTYGYDQAGNLISAERPKEGETPAIEDTYTYNGEGLRVSQTTGGTTSYLTWDMSEGLPLLLNDETNSYIYGPDDLPIEQINTENHATYLHHDQQGSTRLLTQEKGEVTGTYSYGAYGETTGHTGTATTPLGYDAQYTSSDTGLIYMRARTYDPTTAQFLSVDPFVALTGAPYSYAEDDPINKADPSGRCGLVCVGGIVLGGVAVATGVGAVVVGAGAVATALTATSAVAGVAATVADTKECVSHGGVACVGAGAGVVATGGAGAVVVGTTGDVAAGATAIGITSGGIALLSDVAGAIVPGSVLASESFEDTCG